MTNTCDQTDSRVPKEKKNPSEKSRIAFTLPQSASRTNNSIIISNHSASNTPKRTHHGGKLKDWRLMRRKRPPGDSVSSRLGSFFPPPLFLESCFLTREVSGPLRFPEEACQKVLDSRCVLGCSTGFFFFFF